MAKQKKNYLSKHWVETVDPGTGKTYYANTKTKETTWQRPIEQIKQDIKENGPYVPKNKAGANNGKAPKDVWVERQDPETGKVFFYNPVSKQTSWHRPEKVLSHDVHTVQQGTGLWEERIDPRTGRAFFYNPVLKVTSWVNPDEEEEEKKDNNGVIKRLSMNVARLSVGLSRRSGLGGGFPMGKGNRNSASFTMDNPAMPVQHNSARQSLRLGADDISTDMFENLRKMQNAKPMSVRLSTTNNERAKEDFLNINLQEEMDTVDLSCDILEFKTYATQNFKLTKKKMFGSKNLDWAVVSSYQKTPIKQALHVFHDKYLAADALLSFKFLLMYMGCKKKGKGEAITAQDFVKMGIQTKVSFQGELYAQLIKQSTKNAYEDQLEAVFELFALCSGSFPPPEDLEPYVKSHLRSQVETSASSRIKQLALYSLLRMSRYKERLFFPSLQEIAAVRSIDTVELTIELISADPVTMQVDSWTTVKDVKERIQARFDIIEGEPFSLFEISNGDQDRHLADTDMILDVIGLWEDTGGDFQCYFKIRLYFDINEEDTAAVELAYLQTVFEVIDQRYPCEEIDAIRLAALEAQEKFGDFDGTDVFGDQLAAYIPHRFYDVNTADNMKKDIYAEYQRMQGTDKLQCMINYMAYVKKWKFYGCAYFFAEPLLLKVLAKEFPKTVLIAINAKGIMIVDPETKDVIVEYPYSEIVTWGHSEANFVLVVGNLVRSTKLFFSSIDGKDMNQLIHAYVHKLMEAQTEEERDKVLQQHFGEE